MVGGFVHSNSEATFCHLPKNRGLLNGGAPECVETSSDNRRYPDGVAAFDEIQLTACDMI